MRAETLAICAIIYIGGTVGPDGPITGWIAVKGIGLLLLTHWFLGICEWIDKRFNRPQGERSET